MSSWRLLFKKRKAWAEFVLAHAERLMQRIRETDAATKTTQRSVTVAFSNLETHSVGLGDKLAKLREWADGVMDDREKALNGWEPTVRQLLRIPVHEEFKKYGMDEKGSRKVNCLSDFFDIKEVQIAAVTAGTLAQRFEREIHELGNNIEDICSMTVNLKTAIQQSGNKAPLDVEEQLSGLLEEVSLLVNKIRTDNEYARTLQGPKSASAASKRAYASTTDYLPGLTAVAADFGKLLIAVCERKVCSKPPILGRTILTWCVKNAVSTTCHDHLQNIAVIQSISAPVNPQINKLNAAYQEEDGHFQLLSLVERLPISYGLLLIECVRRREWSEKFQHNGQKLVEDLASFKEDEEKRRRKWQRSTGLLLPFELGESQILRAELNTRGDASGGLPKVTRQDFEAYLASLKAVGGLDAVVKDLTQALQEIDKPSKRINKRLKGFKMGSIEAGMMGSSFILNGRNDEEVKILRADKEQLSERIRGYESRIRKLEDLLHRGRTSGGTPYPANNPTGRPSTPGLPQPFPSSLPPAHSPEHTSARPATAQHRSSSDNTLEATYKARLAELLAELAAEKERAVELQKMATENTESEKAAMNAKIMQADETKRDLFANLEATVQQNNIERKALTSEIEELKERLDSTYAELDRVEEEKVKPLEHELELLSGELSHLREDREREVQRNRSLVEQLKTVEQRADAETKGLRAELESQMQRTEEESRRADEATAALAESDKSKAEMVEQIARLEKEFTDTRTALETNRESLLCAMKRAHGHLSPGDAPEDLNTMLDRIEALISQTVAHNKELSESVEAEKVNSTALRGEMEFLQSRFDSRTLRAKDLTQRLYTHNARSIQLLESLGYRVVRGEDSVQIVKVPRNSANSDSTMLTKSTTIPAGGDTAQKSSPLRLENAPAAEDIGLLYWMESPDSDTESEKYSKYLKTIVAFDLDAFSETIITRVKKAEQDVRQLMKQCRAYREKYYRARDEASDKIAFKSFKAGDLALFLPTRNQVTRPWAAFNVGAPHFFLREQDSHKLASRDWLLARISKVAERVVDLSRSTASINLPHGIERSSIGGHSSGGESIDDENPFELSDGLRWYLLDATEEKSGAPSTPGLSASTVASANVDAKGSLRSRKPITGAKKKLSEITTEHSRRSSSGSRMEALEGVHETITALEPPRTPVEKIAASIRSRAGSIRSLTTQETTTQR